MSEENLVGGKVNVEKYMALLQSESDLKDKLQKLYLKMKETEAEDKAEIARLQDLLNEQKIGLSPADKSDQLKLKAELNALKMELDTSNAKLSNCQRDCAELKEQLDKTDKQVSDSSSASSEPDDLTLINGIGPKLKEKLNQNGITQFAQIAAWKAKDISEFDDRLSFKGRIQRDDWVKQAKALVKK